MIIDTFITARRADGLRQRTLDDYHRVLARAMFKLDMNAPSTWTREMVRAYVADLRAQLWSPATIALHIRYLRAFWKWCHAENYTGEDFSAIIPAPARTIREETLLTTAEFTHLVQACAGDRWALRDRAIVLMLADTGLRRNEFISLQRAQVIVEDGSAYLLLPGIVAKNGHERFAFLGCATTTALRAYLDARDDDDPALFISERGPLGGDGLYH